MNPRRVTHTHMALITLFIAPGIITNFITISFAINR